LAPNNSFKPSPLRGLVQVPCKFHSPKAAKRPGLTQALGRSDATVTTILRFAFILTVLWLGISVVYALPSDWFDLLISRCLLEEKPYLCWIHDLIYGWGWLVVIALSLLMALLLTFALRPRAA
jgi:hypothetical protein